VANTYEIKLAHFEGPFDLLLFFIERDELDIQDIPITKIAKDFLDFVHKLGEMNIELASEFILFAATLMKIKAKMLLPRKEKDEFGNDIDPRMELVQKLLEYKQFKATLPELQTLEEIRIRQVKRGNLTTELAIVAEQFNTEHEIHSLTLFKLLKAFDKVVHRFNNQAQPVQHTVVRYNYTLEDSKIYLQTLTRHNKETSFEKMFEICQDRIHAVFIFLAMLELVQLRILTIKMGVGFNSFYLATNEKYLGEELF
jgi:segregation and condensation protein A